MFCPKCMNISRLDEKPDGKYDCSSCAGAFVDIRTIKKVIPWFKLELTSKNISVFPCPNDQEMMLTQQVQGIELESCPKCGGIWFDKNEIKEMRKRERPDFNMPKQLFSDMEISEDSDYDDILMFIMSFFTGNWIGKR